MSVSPAARAIRPLLVLCASLAPAMALIPPAHADTEILDVVEDTWIDGLGSTTIRGSDTALGICPVVDYWIYLKFDLSALPGPPTDAEIRMTRIDGSRPEEISLYLISDDSWSEATLTGVNRPEPADPDPADALAVGEEIVPYDRWMSMALTDVIAQEYAGDGVLSVMLREDPGTVFDVRHFNSREAAVGADEKPQLVVTVPSTGVPQTDLGSSWGRVKTLYR
jgi:hypothetical protein